MCIFHERWLIVCVSVLFVRKKLPEEVVGRGQWIISTPLPGQLPLSKMDISRSVYDRCLFGSLSSRACDLLNPAFNAVPLFRKERCSCSLLLIIWAPVCIVSPQRAAWVNKRTCGLMPPPPSTSFIHTLKVKQVKKRGMKSHHAVKFYFVL